jgi:hypothetical protein
MARINNADTKAYWWGPAARGTDLAGASTTIERAGTLLSHAWARTATKLVESTFVALYDSTK